LAGPKGLAFRPTTGRIREYIFFILREEVPNSRFLDLFAGTGSLGIEAFSSGAAKGVFVESSGTARDLLRRNLETCGFSAQASIIPDDVFSALKTIGKRGETFDFVFADPPFKAAFQNRIVSAVADAGVLRRGGCLVLEHDRRDLEDGTNPQMILSRRKRFGDCTVSFYVQGAIHEDRGVSGDI
jgi:16S rRNA (guanine(966)-N(2))-methyltransferase RsmD